MADSGWRAIVNSYVDAVKHRLLSESEFDAIITELAVGGESPVQAIEVIIDRPALLRTLHFGAAGASDPDNTMTEELSTAATLKVRVWRRPGTSGSDLAAFAQAVISLVKAYWKSDDRHAKSNMLLRSNLDRNQLIDRTILHELQSHDTVAVFYADIDGLKRINEILHHEGADDIIAIFAACLEEEFAPHGIFFHRSGDEFATLLPGATATQALQLARKIGVRLATLNVDEQIAPLSGKIGITFIDHDQQNPTYSQFETEAEAATASGEMVYRRRGRLYIGRDSEIPDDNETTRVQAICGAKVFANETDAFASPWLNLISRSAYDAAIVNGPSGIEAAVADALEWISPELVKSMIASAARSGTLFAPMMSSFDICVAVAHGLLRFLLVSTEEHSLSIRAADELAGSMLEFDGASVLLVGDGVALTATIDIGSSFTVSESALASCLSPVILVQIGMPAIAGLHELAADRIIIDDRPTRGGGLPDFWEAALSRLISKMEENIDITDVLVVGNRESARLTVTRLEEVLNWERDADYLSTKTGTPRKSVTNTAERLRGHVHYANENTALSALYDILRKHHSFERAKAPSPVFNPPVLTRVLRADDVELGLSDGIRVESIRRAYPIVVEIVRSEKHGSIITDQAGQRLLELMDFKVVLTKPAEDLVPTFYQAEQESLENYFESEFCSDTGLFRSRLLQGGQLNEVVAHVADIASRPVGSRYATRRAILIVPHIVKPGNLEPVGLVSIRIVPRFAPGSIVLNYSFTWRTVEAIVGFPYSIYGSVRFSQYVTELIRKSIGQYGDSVELGQVSYIAHSLHFFLDSYGQQIARHIVNEASA